MGQERDKRDDSPLNAELVEYFALSIFNLVSYPIATEEQEAAWDRLTEEQQAFANKIWKREEELEGIDA